MLHPAKLTGEFITKLIESPSIKPYLSGFFKPVDTAASTPIRLGAPKDPVTFTLISALNSTHLDLIRLIYWTFEESFPLFHQLFRCSMKTTKEDIELFFGRILYCREAIDRYLVLGINLISNDLQQVNCVYYIDVRDYRKSEEETLNLECAIKKNKNCPFYILSKIP